MKKNLFKVSDSVKTHTLAITKHQIQQTTGRVDTIASTTPILIFYTDRIVAVF